jgi:hypothetical protein
MTSSKITRKARQNQIKEKVVEPIVEKEEYFWDKKHYKFPSIWKIEKGVMFPVVILTKPKGCPQELFDNFISRIEVKLKPQENGK